MFMNKELKKKIKEVTEQIILEDKKKREFLSKKIDYNFLQELVDKSNENQDLVITLYMHTGDKIVITQKYKAPEPSYGYNGEPSELEIR